MNSQTAMHTFLPNTLISNPAVETCARIASFASCIKCRRNFSLCTLSTLIHRIYFLYRASISAQDTQSYNQSTQLFAAKRKKFQHSISCTSDFLERRKNSF